MQYFQTKRAEKPKEERIENYHPQGEEFDKAHTYHQQLRTDETVMSEGRLKSEKITVSGGEIPRTEETEKPTYPKAIDIGRIVIDEIPEQKEPLQKRDIPTRDKVNDHEITQRESDRPKIQQMVICPSL